MEQSSSFQLTYIKRTRIFLQLYWRMIFAISWFIILLPIIITDDSSEMRCAYVVLLVAGYWVTECLPIGITSLIPIVLLPLLGILSTQETCFCYMNDTLVVFICGLIFAIAIEHSNLHMRIALIVMKTLGCSHTKLLGGLCTVTTFLSMWIANAAATAMMVPIAFAILNQLEKQGLGKVFDDKDSENTQSDPKPTNLTKAYMFAAAYASTFGGTGTIIGTPTNLAFKGIYEYNFPDAEPITFGNWMVVSIPQMAANSFLLWLYLRVAFLGFLRPHSKDAEMARIGPEGEAIANQVIDQNLKNLGPMTFHEKGVAFLFSICIFLWIFRAPGFIRGWAEMLTNVTMSDSAPAVFTVLLMFFTPREPVFIHFFNKNPSKRPNKSSEGLITWQIIQKKMPWSLLFLLGSGFAISRGNSVSGLAMKLGLILEPLRKLPPILILLIVLIFANTLTEFTSNVGTANIILPIVAHMCIAIRLHPLYLMMPVALMCSYAFRMPVGTPPNAIVTIVGRVETRHLMAYGWIPSFYSLMVLMTIFPTWGTFIFDINEFPAWAEQSYIERKP